MPYSADSFPVDSLTTSSPAHSVALNPFVSALDWVLPDWHSYQLALALGRCTVAGSFSPKMYILVPPLLMVATIPSMWTRSPSWMFPAITPQPLE